MHVEIDHCDVRSLCYNSAMGNHRRSLRRLKPRVRRRTQPGTKPGTLTIPADARPTTIRVMAYDKDRVVEREVHDPRRAAASWSTSGPSCGSTSSGSAAKKRLRAIAEIFHIHPLALEDVVHVHQRAKVDPYDENLYCVLRIPDPIERAAHRAVQPGAGQELRGDVSGAAGRLLRSGSRRHAARAERDAAGTSRPDYLAYRLIDAAIDAYFPVLEKIGDQLDELDDQRRRPPKAAQRLPSCTRCSASC